MTTEELQTQLTAVEAERDALLKRHRAVCKCCAMIDANPKSTIDDFLKTYSKKNPE